MDGVHPDLVRKAPLTELLESQSQPFAGRGEVEVDQIMDMTPLLRNEPATRDRIWGEDGIGFWIPEDTPSG